MKSCQHFFSSPNSWKMINFLLSSLKIKTKAMSNYYSLYGALKFSSLAKKIPRKSSFHNDKWLCEAVLQAQNKSHVVVCTGVCPCDLIFSVNFSWRQELKHRKKHNWMKTNCAENFNLSKKQFEDIIRAWKMALKVFSYNTVWWTLQ